MNDAIPQTLRSTVAAPPCPVDLLISVHDEWDCPTLIIPRSVLAPLREISRSNVVCVALECAALATEIVLELPASTRGAK